MASDCDRTGPAFLQQTSALRSGEQAAAHFPQRLHRMASAGLQFGGNILLAAHLLHNAIHAEIAAHLQRLDVRGTWRRQPSQSEDQTVGGAGARVCQLEQAGPVQFSKFLAALAVAQRCGHHD